MLHKDFYNMLLRVEEATSPQAWIALIRLVDILSCLSLSLHKNSTYTQYIFPPGNVLEMCCNWLLTPTGEIPPPSAGEDIILVHSFSQ